MTLQEHIPGDSLSRVSSFDYLASTILMPIGTAVVGPIATAVGTHETLLGMSAIGIACAVAFLAGAGGSLVAARRLRATVTVTQTRRARRPASLKATCDLL